MYVLPTTIPIFFGLKPGGQMSCSSISDRPKSQCYYCMAKSRIHLPELHVLCAMGPRAVIREKASYAQTGGLR